jgi:hypothetical protein
MAEGESLRSICRDGVMPHRATVHRWLADENRQHFRDQYARAADDRADAMFEDMLEIADTPVTAEKVTTKPDGKREVTTGDAVERSKLRVDARKWALARMAPKKYGDKQFLDVVKRDIPKLADDASTEELAEAMAVLRARG